MWVSVCVCVQGVRGRGAPLPSPAPKEPMQGVRGLGLVPAPAPMEQMQGVRGTQKQVRLLAYTGGEWESGASVRCVAWQGREMEDAEEEEEIYVPTHNEGEKMQAGGRDGNHAL